MLKVSLIYVLHLRRDDSAGVNLADTMVASVRNEDIPGTIHAHLPDN